MIRLADIQKCPLCLFLLLIMTFTWQNGFGQKQTPEAIKSKIAAYKADIRGPYKSIRWFCNDGTVREPKDPCPTSIGGIQHATYKDEVEALSASNHIFLGQILAYTNKDDFWDEQNQHSRLKQYQIGRYLARIDDGWINRKGQYYRGSIQIEDEQTWGVEFYEMLLKQDQYLRNNYYLILQSLKDIPHQGDDDLAQLMRSQSKVLSDSYSPFMELRIKIHSNPEPEDISATEKFRQQHKSKLTDDQDKKFSQLITTMKTFHKPVSFATLEGRVKKLNKSEMLTKALFSYLSDNKQLASSSELSRNTAEILLTIRENILTVQGAKNRLEILDIVNELESILFKAVAQWEPNTMDELLSKIYTLEKGAVGTGMIELWEWKKVSPSLIPPNTPSLSLATLTEKLETARGIVEWSSAMVKATYQQDVNIYSSFEPKAYQFIDDRVRSSIALQLGKSVGELGAFLAAQSSLTNKVMSLRNQSTIRGLNPGYAYGELVVVSGSPEEVEVESDRIYIFDRAPADLKPVAGIATVSEGNLVSHVQLLARNLGIPNATISDENLKEMSQYNGQKVFYAVSNRGNVIIKPTEEMTKSENLLFSKKVRKEDKIEVPIGTIRLDQTKVLNLREVDADDSGKLCGPKAANLGQLKSMYPESVVEGFVIPFGIFRQHMDQQMSGQSISYWEFLSRIFKEADMKRSQGMAEKEVEQFQLAQLQTLREAIKKMPLKTAFTDDLSKSFMDILGKPMGKVPVFLRSDTNMEDLKDFTGAGLNLTIFNALEKERILTGIRDVWASPYTERSFKWRQKYLSNPENVFPSILVIPSVDVDYSGVLITKGISSGDENDLTVAFSRGAGGAVDGQSAETYTIKKDGRARLLSPARDAFYNTLPQTGGTGRKGSSFERPVLNERNIKQIYDLATDVRENMATRTKSDYKGAYDIELGFKEDKLWLFQIRPFVENKNALGSDYLKSITPSIDRSKQIPLNAILER
ncbi:MAG: PEP/pyruvate-binding domain-containing protein [Cyclobacteriaceae bacterium]